MTEALDVIVWKDAFILAAAVYANADYIATLDRRDFLNHRDKIEARFPIKVRDPGGMPREITTGA